MTFFFHRFSRKRVARQPASSIIFVRTLQTLFTLTLAPGCSD